ncbi:winged helix-turn-helix domain-containing protein [Patescibacteria group bacterium]|nr:winged helix-turn-helix domain-containing protein [Patescibacteria group bacterium]
MIKTTKRKEPPNKPSPAARLLRLAGDESRMRILCLIFGGDKICVSEIAERLDMSVAVVSHHLKVMARAGLFRPLRRGKEVCYIFEKSDFANDLKKFICKYNSP